IASDTGPMSRLPQTDPEGRVIRDPDSKQVKSRRSPIYARFVSGEFFAEGETEDGDEVGALVKAAGGALEPFSVWYREAAGKRALELALQNIENKTYVQSYHYDRNHIAAAQEYIRAGGADTLKESFRIGFRDRYLRPGRVK
ncbi:MAG: hypothetical protein IJV04_03950, partial [Lachnospiraceae bacterium]|nr:hypothetical protein [Lachnospiraceae bacterium]